MRPRGRGGGGSSRGSGSRGPAPASAAAAEHRRERLCDRSSHPDQRCYSPLASVVLSTDASCYSATAPIIVTIENHTSTTIGFWDHQSGCSVVSIALRTHDHWQQVDWCFLMSPSVKVTLAAEHRLLVTIGPPEDDGQQRWFPGTYKAFFSYEVVRVQATATTPMSVGPGGDVESAAFSVS